MADLTEIQIWKRSRKISPTVKAFKHFPIYRSCTKFVNLLCKSKFDLNNRRNESLITKHYKNNKFNFKVMSNNDFVTYFLI